MFPLSIRNIFYTWTSIRPWIQSLIIGIPGWPLALFIAIIGVAAIGNEKGDNVIAAIITGIFIVLWYGSLWAMGQQDIRQLTFKSGRVWFIAAIIVFLAGMVSVSISLPLLIAGTYAIYAWDQIIAARKWRFMLIGNGVIILALILNSVYPAKFVLSEIAWALPVLVILIAPKQVDKFISWVYNAVALAVAGFLAMAAVADKVPEENRVGVISAITVVTIIAIIWVKKSSRGKLLNAAHQEKKEAAANSPTARKLRRGMFVAVMALYVLLHGVVAVDAQGAGSVGAWLMVMMAAVFVFAIGYRLDVYDKQQIAHQSNGL